MKIIQQSIVFEEEINGEAIIRKIESAARCCYQSTHNVGDYESAKRFVASLIRGGHESTIEHVNISARVVTNRGISHEFVRHRIASYSQESTRYCSYASGKFGGECCFIWPWFLGKMDVDVNSPLRGATGDKLTWLVAMEFAQESYFSLLSNGRTPQEARGVLPNDLKTEFVVTMNLRSLRNFFRLRCAVESHPQIRALAIDALTQLKAKIPVVFEDIAAFPVAIL